MSSAGISALPAMCPQRFRVQVRHLVADNEGVDLALAQSRRAAARDAL
jgi:hypothetical protein